MFGAFIGGRWDGNSRTLGWPSDQSKVQLFWDFGRYGRSGR
jgi:hypothetical protein